mmetsp:Transcript_114611/g.319153  ORF Transcript_114611/g.319153 Transcript_114611/m.319153 type:complete len:364 (-) Transcript_114611:603-1694(-)
MLPHDLHHRHGHLHGRALPVPDLARPGGRVGQEDPHDRRRHEVLGMRETGLRRGHRRGQRLALLPRANRSLHPEALVQVRVGSGHEAGHAHQGGPEVLDMRSSWGEWRLRHGQRAEGDVLDAAAPVALDGLPPIGLRGLQRLPRPHDLPGVVCCGVYPPELCDSSQPEPLLLVLRTVPEEGRVLAPLHVLHAAQRPAAPVCEPLPPARHPGPRGRSRYGGEPGGAAAVHQGWAHRVGLLPRRRHRPLPHSGRDRPGPRLRRSRGHDEELRGSGPGCQLRVLRCGRRTHCTVRHVPRRGPRREAQDPGVRRLLLDAHRHHRLPHHHRPCPEHLRFRQGHSRHYCAHGFLGCRLLLRDPRPAPDG